VPYDEELAHRIRAALAGCDAVTERAMFGGLAFMVAGNMAVGVSRDGGLIVRLDPDQGERLVARPHVSPFPGAARPMRGWLRIDGEGVATGRALDAWIGRSVAFVASLPPKRRRRR